MLDVPRRYREVSALGHPALPALPAGRPLRIVVWNLQYCAGRGGVFFYDGGRRVHVPRAEADRTLQGIGAALRALDGDVLLLQELDRGSARTDRVDQLARLVAALPGYAAVSVPVHRNRFVPYPWWHPLGRVDFHLATLARAPLAEPRRVALPNLREHPIIARFNLHRALLVAQVPMQGGGALWLGNTHLSAFTGGDDTLARQVGAVAAEFDRAGPRALLGGDFNLLPPGDDPARLPAGRTDHPRVRPEIDRFFAAHHSALDPAGQREPARGTWLPPGAASPDRTLDWLFVQPGVDVLRAWVEPVDPALSDHRPVVAEVRVRAGNPASGQEAAPKP